MAKGTVASESIEIGRGADAIWGVSRPSGLRTTDRGSDLLGASALAALETALGALGAPALVVDGRGEVVCSNAEAGALIAGGGMVVRRSPPAADPKNDLTRSWDVRPIRGTGPRGWSLAILRPPARSLGNRWNLTNRQREVLTLVARGMTNAGIAEFLGIRLGTVEFHISAIFDKAGVHSRAALIASLTRGELG